MQFSLSESDKADNQGMDSISLDSPLEISVTSNLKVCCKPTYRPRRVKNKGAILVLIWNHLIFSVFHLLLKYKDITWGTPLAWFSMFTAFGSTLLIAGLLADTRIGRYKLTCCSIWIIWIVSLLATMSLIMAQLIDGYFLINVNILGVLFIFMAIGFGGYQASIVQLGLDQLHDASTTEIKSFIVWYTWTLFSSGVIVDLTANCLSKKYIVFLLLFVSANVTLAVVLLLACNHHLIKEPIQQNPLQLIYNVIKYAVRNKHPRQRSAFTYCEDELPSRIDFGKHKYGGPFTTEQVEDVKTFLRLLPIVAVGGTLAGTIFVTSSFKDKLVEVYTNLVATSEPDGMTSRSAIAKCFHRSSFTNTIYNVVVLLIVVHELFLYPVFQRCYRQVESLQKIVIGIIGHALIILNLMAYDVISRHTFISNHGYNVTIQCTFDINPGALSTSFSYYWIAIPNILFAISMAMLYTGAIEFVSAQVPSSMKGLTIGIIYIGYLLSNTVWFALSQPFHVSSFWGTGTLSCAFWYMLTMSMVQICICPLLLIIIKCYKKRSRQDVLPNEHIFAERYYGT